MKDRPLLQVTTLVFEILVKDRRAKAPGISTTTADLAKIADHACFVAERMSDFVDSRSGFSSGACNQCEMPATILYDGLCWFCKEKIERESGEPK